MTVRSSRTDRPTPWPRDLFDKPWRGGEPTAARVFRAIAKLSELGGEGCNRRDIALQLNTSATTVSKAAADLVSRRLLSEGTPAPRGQGRPTVPLRLDSTCWVTIGIKIVDEEHRPRKLVGVVTDLSGHVVLVADDMAIQLHEDRNVFRRLLVTQIANLSHSLEVRLIGLGRRLLGVGVELGGHIDDGNVVFSVNNGIGADRYFDEDDDEPDDAPPRRDERRRGARPPKAPAATSSSFAMQADLSWETRQVVVVSNDVNALAISDALYGRTAGSSALTIGVFWDGIGGALTINGRVYTGAFGAAGDIGHVKVDVRADGGAQNKCRCGRKRHLECYSTPSAIARGLGLSWGEALADGGPETIRAFSQAGRALGSAIATTMTLVNPEEVIVYVPPGLEDDAEGPGVDAFHKQLHRRYLLDAFSTTSTAPVHCRPLSQDAASRNGAAAAGAAVLDAYLLALERSYS